MEYQGGQPASNVAIAGHPEADRGSCGNSDRRHVVNMSTVYQTPRVSSGVLGVLASDWQVSAILTAQSGGFFTVTTGVDAALSGTTQQRPNQVLDNVYQKEGYRWLNPAAFQAPATGTYGNLGANTFQGPGRFNIDTGLTRNPR